VVIAIVTALAVVGVRVAGLVASSGALQVKEPPAGATGMPEGYEPLSEFRGEPVRLPCGTIGWRLVGEVPSGGEAVVQEAFDLAEEMSLIDFERDDGDLHAAITITVEFSSAKEVNEEAQTDAGRNEWALGVASVWSTPWAINRTEILINEDFFESTYGKNRNGTVLVVLHEVGHAIGLGHSDLRSSLMYPSAELDTKITREDVQAFRDMAPTC
jgi:hypothetical protein